MYVDDDAGKTIRQSVPGENCDSAAAFFSAFFCDFLTDRVFRDFPAFFELFVALHVHAVHCSVSNVSSWRLFTQI